MYKIEFEKKALHDLNKLDTKVKERIWGKLQNTKEDPFRYFEKLVETEGFELRAGDWRIVADIDRVEEIIVVLKVGHRRNVYER